MQIPTDAAELRTSATPAFPLVEQLARAANVVRISGPMRSARAAGRVTYFEESVDNGLACLEAVTFEYHPLVMTRAQSTCALKDR